MLAAKNNVFMKPAGPRFANVAMIRVLIIGDSLSAGNGGGDAQGMVNARPKSWPTKVRDWLISQGYAAQSESWAEAINADCTVAQYDPRVTQNGWARSAAATIGGRTMQATAANQWVFAPSTAVDTFETYYPISTYGSVNTTIDAEAPTLISQTGTLAMRKDVLSRPLGMHTIKFDWVSGTCYALPTVAYNSAMRGFMIMNMGMRGRASTTWVNDVGFPWRSFTAIPDYRPHISILLLGTNDKGINTPDQYKTAMLALAAKAKEAGGVVMLVVPPPWETEGSLITYADMIQANIDLAAQLACPLYRLDQLMVSWAAATAAGYTVPDGLHYTDTGYASWAPGLGQMLVNLAVANGWTP